MGEYETHRRANSRTIRIWDTQRGHKHDWKRMGAHRGTTIMIGQYGHMEGP